MLRFSQTMKSKSVRSVSIEFMKLADIRSILVPIDFSKMSIVTTETAKGIARRFGATIHLAHVHQRQYPVGFMGPVLAAGKTPVSFEEHRRETLREELKELAGRCGVSPNAVHLCEGASVFDELSRLAQKISADLIVMPTHGRTGLKHVVLGSTAERMVQHSPCPVLVTRGRRTTSNESVTKGVALAGIDAILVPVDFSSASLHALEYAIAFAERVAARLIVFHAVYFDDTFSIAGFDVDDLSRLKRQGVSGRRTSDSEIGAPCEIPRREVRNRRRTRFAGFGDLCIRRTKRCRSDHYGHPRAHGGEALVDG